MATVLVVDDDPDIVDSCRTILETKGYRVRGALTRLEAMELATAEAPDLVLLDVMMEDPDDGVVLARHLRATGLRAPIVMLTAISRAAGFALRPHPELLPVQEILEKPVAPSRLLEVVGHYLNPR